MTGRTGLVVERQRRHITVESDDGERHLCLSRNRALRPLVGDRVRWQQKRDGTCIATQVLSRDSTLTRINSRGKREAVAANLTRLMVVVAAAPSADWFLLDRYLVATELMDVMGVIVFNKIDLVEAPPEILETYREAGYGSHLTSVKTGTGLDQLAAAMAGERCALVGQSGVGKSSLLNALLGADQQTVGALTEKGRQGRHTTTATTLHRLDSGAELIDSPGVRSYAPYLDDPRDLARGFKEFQALLGQCRFDDCQHLAEPDCAIKQACAQGLIDERRYQSYKRLHDTLTSLRAKP